MTASGAEIGTVLIQEVDGEDHPILFISCKLQPAERKYSTVEKEALAVKWTMGSFQYFLTGTSFTLVVDHASLLWMASMKEHKSRVLRWYGSLLPFHFTVHHQAGKDHAWLTACPKCSRMTQWLPAEGGCPVLRVGLGLPGLPGGSGDPSRGNGVTLAAPQTATPEVPSPYLELQQRL